MKVYYYYSNVRDTDFHVKGEFMYEKKATLSPREKNKYLIPANSTIIKPHFKDGYACIFDEKKQLWENIIDHRKKIVFNIENKQGVIVNYLGDIKNGYTFEEPINIYCEFKNKKWIITKNSKKKELKDIILNKINNIDEVIYNSNRYQVDNYSILNINQAILSLDNNTYIKWRTSANILVDINKNDLIEILNIKTRMIQDLIEQQYDIECNIDKLNDEDVSDFIINI